MVLRTHNEEEAALLRKESIDTVFLGEHELARGMADHILDELMARAAMADQGPEPAEAPERRHV